MNVKKVLPAVIVLAIAAAGFAVWRNHQLTQKDPEGIASGSGRIELKHYPASALRPGKVTEVAVSQGDRVGQGAVIVKIDSAEADAKLAAAQAAKARAEGAVERAKSAKSRADAAKNRTGGAISQAQAEVEAQRAKLAIAQDDLNNAIALRKQNLVSKSEVVQRQKARDAQRAAVQAAEAAKRQAQSGEGEADAAINEADAGVAEAQAAVREADAQIRAIQSAIGDLTVKAPHAGVVEYVTAETGSVIGAGMTAASIADPFDAQMDVFFPVAVTSKISLGDEARIVVDGSGRVYPAVVSFIAGQAQFTPKTVETESERQNMSYRVTLKIKPEPLPEAGISGGVTAEAYIQYDKNAAWPENAQLAGTVPTDQQLRSSRN